MLLIVNENDYESIRELKENLNEGFITLQLQKIVAIKMLLDTLRNPQLLSILKATFPLSF